MEFKLEGETHIELQALLKVTGLCDTGGGAKLAITQGKVQVDGIVEIRRSKKITAGQMVSFGAKKITVLA